VTQEERSKIMNSSIFTWGVMGPVGHSAGKVRPALGASSTWKSSKRTRPHWAAGAAPTGVLKV